MTVTASLAIIRRETSESEAHQPCPLVPPLHGARIYSENENITPALNTVGHDKSYFAVHVTAASR